MIFIFHFLQFLAYIPMNLVFPSLIKGRKNMPKGKAVLCSNHTSSMDSPLFTANMFERKIFLAKSELFENKFRAGILKFLGAMPIDRENPSLDSIKKALGVLKKNKKLVIFPEGTRNSGMAEKGEIGETKNGAVLFAVKGKAPIVPVWICRKPRIFRLTKIVIGEPIYLDEFYGRKLDEATMKEAGEIINKKLLELGSKYSNGKVRHK